MLDRCSIASRSIEVTLMWTPLDSSIWRDLNLNTSRSIENRDFLFKALALFFSHFFYLSWLFLTPHLPKLTSLIPNLFLTHFFSLDCSSLHRYDLVFPLFIAFHSYRFRFLLFMKIFGIFFFKIDEVFEKFLGWALFKWSYMLMHCITFSF